MTSMSNPHKEYGRSGWSWWSETRYNLAVGVAMVVIGTSAMISHVSPLAAAVGAFFFLTGAALVVTAVRAKKRRL